MGNILEPEKDEEYISLSEIIYEQLERIEKMEKIKKFLTEFLKVGGWILVLAEKLLEIM